MAKTKSGLPEGFDLKVSSNDLVSGPARLPGYLERGSFVVPEVVEQTVEAPLPSETLRVDEPPKVELPPVSYRQPVTPPIVAQQPVQRLEPELPAAKKPKAPVNRLQINLSTETQLKVGELVEQIRETSPEKQVNFNDVIQALILSLYDARSSLDVSRLPTRGKWGSPMAKSFPAALSAVIREAIVNHEQASGGNPFKKVVGG